MPRCPAASIASQAVAEWIALPGGAYVLPLIVVVLLLLWLGYRHRRRHDRSVEEVVKSISYEYMSNVIIPKADDGEIHLDHVLLTAEGLLIVEVKDVQGIVFGSDKMQDWTVIASDRRFTFSNPQPRMFDRIAAVRQIVRQIPVTGRILFLDGAEFTKGVPGLVTTLDDLLGEFGELDKLSATAKIEAFKPHWDAVSQAARPADA